MRTSFITEKKEIETIINTCKTCFVGFIDNDGSPYVIPMNFGYQEGIIILHSGPHGKHLGLLEKNNQICVTFCNTQQLVYQHPDVACSYSMVSQSVVCKGTVTFVENLDQKEELMNQFMKNYSQRSFSYSKPALTNVKVWKVVITEMTAKSFGQGFKNSMYTPK